MTITFKIVFCFCVMGSHDWSRLSPDHEKDPDPILGLLLQQLAHSQVRQVQLLLVFQQTPIVDSGKKNFG
jgi:hypothetical protein